MSEKVDYNKLTMPLLKVELQKRGLDQSGKKADLVLRLEANDSGLLFQYYIIIFNSRVYFEHLHRVASIIQ